MSLGLNILLIFVFLVIGSVFSGTELALVSLRGSQIEQMEQEDARGAKVAKIARDPNTFLSKGHATPFEGWEVHAVCRLTVCGDKIAYNALSRKE